MSSVFWKVFFSPAHISLNDGWLRLQFGDEDDSGIVWVTILRWTFSWLRLVAGKRTCSTGLLQTLCLIHHRVFSVSPVKRFASPLAFTWVQSMQETSGMWPVSVSLPTSERRNLNSRPFDSRPPLRVSKAGAAWPCTVCSDNPLLIKDYSLFYPIRAIWFLTDAGIQLRGSPWTAETSLSRQFRCA